MDRTAEVEGPPEGDRTVARVPSAAPTTNRIGRFGLAEIALVLSIAAGGVFLYLVARGLVLRRRLGADRPSDAGARPPRPAPAWFVAAAMARPHRSPQPNHDLTGVMSA